MFLLQYKSLLILISFALIFVFERLAPLAKNKILAKRNITNILFWPINILGSLIAIIPISMFASGMHIWQRSLADSILWLIVDILLLDCFLYFWHAALHKFWHAALHKFDFLWKFHIIHHLDTTLDSTSALRFHFGEILFSCLAHSIIIILFSIPFYSILILHSNFRDFGDDSCHFISLQYENI